ncbi:hypothetical protein [Shouchella tritolerans]|uniref:hypothetical protein n=1 Tax=Shouchella tritolerans TaxID=2979466 RepID=UPI000787C46A|nr:hypothetical protein [Shouchella tritolerans]
MAKEYQDYETILAAFDLKIKKSLYSTDPANREDLEQEIKLKIFEKMPVIENMNAPGFYEFVHGANIAAETKALYTLKKDGRQ